MSKHPFGESFCSVCLFVVISGLCAFSQGHAHPADTPTLRQFFQPILGHYGPTTVPSFDEFRRVQHRVSETSSPSEIADGLPFVVQVLTYPNETVRSYGAAALFAIAIRADSAALLSNSETGAISVLLSSPDARLQNTGVVIIGMLQPTAPPEMIPAVVSFLSRTDRDPAAQATAFSLLLKRSPDGPGVATAMTDYLSRPLDLVSRKMVLNGVANSHTKDSRFTGVVIAALGDGNEGIRFTAAQALWRMPQETVLQAESALQGIIENPRESADVKTAAKQALARISHR